MLPTNPVPFLVLGAVLAVTLWRKGYLRLPTSQAASPGVTAPPAALSHTTFPNATPAEAHLLERLDSHTLGCYLVLAKRREADANLAHRLAADAGNIIEGVLTAPFARPGPDQVGPPESDRAH